MKLAIPPFGLFVFLFLLFVHQTSFAQGNLMIVGGGLESDNKVVFDEIIKLSGGPEKAVITVIPAASGVAAQTFAYFSQALIRFGVKAENIHLIPIAMEDDDSTTDVNEASWFENANNLQLADKVRKSSCVWFSGGDQLRIIKTLYKSDGTQTPVLKAVWEMYRQGGLVGGTSAGAAIMSNPMIGSGTSMGALQSGVQTSAPGEDFPGHRGVLITQGLGFFPHGLVDQHFHARSRTARLIIAMGYTGQQLGYGIDENTALVFYGKENKMMVAGAAGITIFDAQKALYSTIDSLTTVENIRVHYLENGDVFYFDSNEVVPEASKITISGNEYFSSSTSIPGGMFTSSPTGFYSLITRYLTDNKEAEKVHSLNFSDEKTAYDITMSKQANTKAFVSRPDNGKDRYTIFNVRLDIIPVNVAIKPMK